MLEKLYLPPAHDGAVWGHSMPTGDHPRHHHAELELNLVLAGTGRYLVDDRVHALTPGALIWLFPKQSHILVDRSPDYRMWIVVFRPRLLRRVCTDASRRVLRAFAPAGDFCRQLPPAALRLLDRQFGEMAGRAGDPPRFNAALTALLLDAWAAFLAADRPAASADLHPAVQRAAQLLRAAPENADLADLARRSGLSRTRLSELFRRQAGVSLVDFRNRTRLERFMDLQARAAPANRKLLPLALEAGFGSYQQFYRVYRRHHGRGPAERSAS